MQSNRQMWQVDWADMSACTTAAESEPNRLAGRMQGLCNQQIKTASQEIWPAKMERDPYLSANRTEWEKRNATKQ